MKVSESNMMYLQLDRLLFNRTASTLFNLLLQNMLQDFILDAIGNLNINPRFIEATADVNNVGFYKQSQQVINNYTKMHTEIQRERLDNIQIL